MARALRLPISWTPGIAVRLTPPNLGQVAPWLRGWAVTESLCHGYDAARTGPHRGTSGRLVRSTSQDRRLRLAATGRRGRGGWAAVRHRQSEQLRPRAGGAGRAGPEPAGNEQRPLSANTSGPVRASPARPAHSLTCLPRSRG